jgi:peptide/nickel transport system substrate-binding protein
MLGFVHPTSMMWGPGVNGYDAKLDDRPAADPAKARQFLAEAGHPNGFEVGMDCPNGRYVKDGESAPGWFRCRRRRMPRTRSTT